MAARDAGSRVRRARGEITPSRGLSSEDLAALAEEIAGRRGAKVRAAHQDGPLRFRIALEEPSGRTDLVFDLDLEFPRAHLAPARPAPASPSPLAATIRNALSGSHVEGAEAVRGERAIAVRFSLAGLARTLWFEAFGRRANLYLLDETNTVLLTPRGEIAGDRQASVGATFTPSPPREGDPRERLTTPGGASPSAEISAAADEAARDRAAGRAHASALKTLRSLSKRADARLASLEREAAEEGAAAEWKRKGELLRASFHLLQPGRERVTVPDYSVDPPVEVEVELDPKADPGEQVAACFERARKAERTVAHARVALPKAREEAERLRAALAEAERADEGADLSPLLAAAGVAVPKEQVRRKGPPEAKPWREFESLDGWRILVGKDADGNDRLTTKHARPEDLFLHVRGGSGSHVIVPTPRGKTVPKETLLDAAELACFYSSRREAERNEVDYAERRYIRKPRGAPPGLVELERCRTIGVRRDDDRRRRLLGRPEGSAGPE